jgi:hypothetical protein
MVLAVKIGVPPRQISKEHPNKLALENALQIKANLNSNTEPQKG